MINEIANAAISPLRQRMIEEMTIHHFPTATQKNYIRAVKEFADFFGHSPAKASPEDRLAWVTTPRSAPEFEGPSHAGGNAGDNWPGSWCSSGYEARLF